MYIVTYFLPYTELAAGVRKINAKVFAFEKNINDTVHLSFTGTFIKC